MRKQNYIVPETTCDSFEEKSLLCQSADASIEDLTISDADFDMF